MNDKWRKVLVRPESTIGDTIKVIDHGSLRIALVVDAGNRLLGTVTDGDIRRAVLKKIDLEQSVLSIMNNNPVVIGSDKIGSLAQEHMRSMNLLSLPVVNDGILCGLEIANQPADRQRFDNPVLLMAGGFGTRLQPLTNDCPKPMLEIGGKPILEIVLKKYIEAGFSNFFISTHYLAEKITNYFGDGAGWGVSIQYLNEKSALGTAGALGLLPRDLPPYPVIVSNADIITNLDPGSLVHHHERNAAFATVCTKQREYTVPYGVIKSDDLKIKEIIEKPTFHYNTNAGVYVLDNAILAHVTKGKPIDMPDLLEQFIPTKNVIIYPIEEAWLDVGQPEDFDRAKRLWS